MFNKRITIGTKVFGNQVGEYNFNYPTEAWVITKLELKCKAMAYVGSTTHDAYQLETGGIVWVERNPQ